MASTIPVVSDVIVEKIRRYKPDLIGDIRGGMRSVSLELIASSTSPSMSSSSPIGSSMSAATQHSINVPSQMHSPETFQYLGFSPHVSNDLFSRLAKRMKEVDDQEDMLSFCQSYVRHRCGEIADSSEDWAKALDDVGIHGRMRDALLDPKHTAIRGTQPLSSWLCEMLETNYDALVDLPAIILHNIEPDRPNIRGRELDTEYMVPATTGGHINLFKSVPLKHARQVITEDGTINLVPLLSYTPTDFAHRGGLYFTQQMWVATQYSELISDACPVCDRRIIEISVPLEHFKQEKMFDLEFGDMWKRLVFFSRRNRTYPKDVSRLRSEHNVIHGPMAHNANHSFARMKGPEEIEKKHLMWEDPERHVGDLGKQLVWMNEEAVERLSVAVREKVWVRKLG